MHKKKFASDKDHMQFCHELFEVYVGADYVAADARIAQQYTSDPIVRKHLQHYNDQLESVEHSSKKLLKDCGCEHKEY